MIVLIARFINPNLLCRTHPSTPNKWKLDLPRLLHVEEGHRGKHSDRNTAKTPCSHWKQGRERVPGAMGKPTVPQHGKLWARDLKTSSTSEGTTYPRLFYRGRYLRFIKNLTQGHEDGLKSVGRSHLPQLELCPRSTQKPNCSYSMPWPSEKKEFMTNN